MGISQMQTSNLHYNREAVLFYKGLIYISCSRSPG